jgi:predicted metallopeptidase
VREVHGRRHGHSSRTFDAPPWFDSGEPDKPFHFSESLRLLCADIAAKYPPLAHIDVSRMIFAFAQARNQRSHGLQARVTPLRFHGGELSRTHRGIPYQVQQFFHDQREIFYIVTFCLPRFFNRDFDDKFVTIFHELFHISPEFNGDLRRHEGRYSVHTASRKRYDIEMMALAREYLHSGADPKLHGFLRLNFAQLRHRHGRVVGHVVPRPKLVPLRPAGFAEF